MPEIGSASLAVIPSFKGFQNNLERGVSGPLDAAGRSGGAVYGDSAGKAAGSRFRATFTRAAKASLLGVAALGVGAFKLAGDSVKLASDLNESLNAVNVSYGKQSKAVQRLGREAADSLGLSNEQFNSLSVRFSAFSKTIAGSEGRKVVTTLDDLTTRASDFASVMNLEVNEAAELFQSGLAGETEPLRRYGLDLSAAAVQAHAWAKGIAESGAELTEQQKIQARYSLLMKQTNQAAGDFANTSDQLANRQRILSARWDNARATLGTALLPILEDLSGWVLDKGIPAFEDFAEWFQGPGIKKIQGFGRFLRDDLAPPLKSAADFAGDLVGWLDKLPKEVKIGGLAGLAALVGGAKLRGGGGGALGTAGKALGLAKPVPVFVTNPGLMTGGVPGKGGTPKVPPVVAPNGAGGAGRAARLLKFAPLLPAAGALGNDQLPDLMTDKEAGQFKRYQANIERSTDFWLDHDRAMRTRVVPMVDDMTGKFRDLFGVVKDVDKSDPKINVAIPGYSAINAFFDKLEGDLEWVTRPRYIRIGMTRDFDTKDGRAMMPGLQERAGGGHMRAGTPYLVGERGPEVFTPYAAGRMTANHQMGGGGGGGVNIYIERIEAQNLDDMMRQIDQRRHRAALEGRRVG